MARSIFEQTGWKRPHPQTICQEHEVLLKIREYDFDKTDRKFLDYVKSRTGIVPFPRYFDMNDKNILDSKARRIFFGRLQDAWELYRAENRIEVHASKFEPPAVGKQLSMF